MSPKQRNVLVVKLRDGSTHVLQPDESQVPSEQLEEAFRNETGPFSAAWITTVDDAQIRKDDVVSFRMMRAIDAYSRNPYL